MLIASLCALCGGEEIRPGHKDFDELADILETLEIDDTVEYLEDGSWKSDVGRWKLEELFLIMLLTQTETIASADILMIPPLSRGQLIARV